MNQQFELYAIIDAQIKELTKEKDELKEKIIQDMVARGEEKEATPFGNFALAKLKTWTYTEKVKELEEEYKARKAQEESTGEATFEIKPSLRFTGIKL